MKTLLKLALVSGIVLLTGPGLVARAEDDAQAVSLHKACEDGDLNAVKSLLGAGVPIDVPTGSYHMTPLMDAATSDHGEVTSYLISQHAKLDVGDSMNSTALLHACWEDKTDNALTLINAGANVNLGSKYGQTPLMYAAKHGNDALVAALLAHKADVNANCPMGAATTWAAGEGHLSTLKLLLDAGADMHLQPSGPVNPGKFQSTLLGDVAYANSVEMIDLLLSKGFDVNAAADNGDTALINAAENDSIAAATELLAKGANIDLPNKEGRTPLMVAVMNSKAPLVQSLIDQHAKLDVQDVKGRTALMQACRLERSDTVKMLVNAGANIDVADAHGETALTLAADIGESGMVDLLKDKGAKRTDLHIIPKDEPATPLPIARQWALAVGAIYTQRDGLSHKILGGHPVDRENARSMLKRSWNISNKAGLLKEVASLRASGHHTRYDLDGVAYLMMNNDEYQRLLKQHPDRGFQIKATRDSFLTWRERTGLAWDLCRASMLINEGYAAGYINETEAWENLFAIAQDTQTNFTSWKEMAINFLDSSDIWSIHRAPSSQFLHSIAAGSERSEQPLE